MTMKIPEDATHLHAWRKRIGAEQAEKEPAMNRRK